MIYRSLFSQYTNLLDNDAANHAGALVGLAVVAVLASGVEGELVGLTGGVQVVLAGELVSVHSLLQNPM